MNGSPLQLLAVVAVFQEVHHRHPSFGIFSKTPKMLCSKFHQVDSIRRHSIIQIANTMG